jgi:hypothetical protein
MKKGQLIVEGLDDKHVVWAFCKKFKVPETFEVVDTEGYENLRDGIDERIKSGTFEKLGFIIDADTDIKSRWQSISDILKTFGYKLPDAPEPKGTIVFHPDSNTFYPLSIGIWIMPNNQLEGMLEDFLEKMIAPNNELLEIAKESLEKVESKVSESERFKESHYAKALIHTFLAWKEPPGRPFGQAINANFFNEKTELLTQFMDWLNRLFGES